jgi:hypothetical protein
VLIRGCEFRQNLPHIRLGKDVSRAVVTGNVFTGSQQIVNQSEGNIKIALNVSD